MAMSLNLEKSTKHYPSRNPKKKEIWWCILTDPVEGMVSKGQSQE